MKIPDAELRIKLGNAILDITVYRMMAVNSIEKNASANDTRYWMAKYNKALAVIKSEIPECGVEPYIL